MHAFRQRWIAHTRTVLDVLGQAQDGHGQRRVEHLLHLHVLQDLGVARRRDNHQLAGLALQAKPSAN